MCQLFGVLGSLSRSDLSFHSLIQQEADKQTRHQPKKNPIPRSEAGAPGDDQWHSVQVQF